MTLNWSDVRIDEYTGGDTSLRLTHLPTATTVSAVVPRGGSVTQTRLRLAAELDAKLRGGNVTLGGPPER